MGPACLLVDDNEEFLASATRLLESQGLHVAGQARSGAEALELARSLRPGVALVDVELGGESGFDVTVDLVAALPTLRVILISTHAEDELYGLIADSPAAGFLAKNAIGADAVRAMTG